MFEPRQRPALIEPDSGDETPRKRIKLNTTSMEQQSGLSILLHAALFSLENFTPTEKAFPSRTSYHEQTLTSLKPDTDKINIPSFIFFSARRKRTFSNVDSLSTSRTVLMSPPRRPQLKGEDKNALKALGPLPLGKPLFAPPHLPCLHSGEVFIRQKRK